MGTAGEGDGANDDRPPPAEAQRYLDEARADRVAAERARRVAVRAWAHARRLEALSTDLARAESVKQVVEATLDHGLAALDAYRGFVALPNADRSALRFVGSRGFTREELGRFEELPLAGSFPVSRAFLQKEPIWIESREDYWRQFNLDPLPQWLSALALPLIVEGQSIGALGFTFRIARALDVAKRELGLALARQCAQALERARLREEEGRTRERLAFLADAGVVLGSTLDATELFAELAQLLTSRLCDWFTLVTLDDQTEYRRNVVRHRDPARQALAQEYLVSFPARTNLAGPFGALSKGGPPVLASRVSDDDLRAFAQNDRHLELLRALGTASCLVVPMNARGRTVGVLSLMRSEAEPPYDAADLALAEEFGRRAALAIDNARLLHLTEEAVRTRDDFLSIASHELRTPLTSLGLQISGWRRRVQQGLEEDQTPTERLAKLERVERQIERLAALIENLLDVSRVMAGRLSFEPTDLDLGEVLREVADRFAEPLARAGCVLECLIAEGCRGRWDRMRIDQLVTNLLANAVKYGAGKPISLALTPTANGFRIVVRDFGIGIAPEDQARIFERFERAVSNRHYGGLGLGLWIARRIVEAMNGSISVKSELGQGAEFELLLPREGPGRGSGADPSSPLKRSSHEEDMTHRNSTTPEEHP